jgi:hypothetical protein
MKKLQLKKPQFRIKKAEKQTATNKLSYKDKVNSVLASWDLKKLTRTMVLLAIPVALVGSYFWYTRLYLDTERRLWIAVNNSMATGSVTRTLTSGGTGNQVVQKQEYFFSPQAVSKSHVSFSQKTATVETNVQTEGISYMDRQYSRYTQFETNQKKADGTTPSLASLLGKWGSTIPAQEDKQSVKDAYIGELVSLVVFGNFDANFRHELINELKTNGVYKISEVEVYDDIIDNEKVTAIPVRVQLKGYATVLQKAFVKAGYGEFAPLNPDNYAETADLKAVLFVSKRDNTIRTVQYGERKEKFSGYGVNTKVSEPVAEMKNAELEAKVREEISGAL